MKFRWIFPIVLIIAVVLSGCGKKAAPPATDQSQTPPPTQQEQPQDVGPPTEVASGKTPEQHVGEYFDAYVAKDFNAAYDLQPAVNKAKQSKEEFSSLRGGFPITDYKILPVREQDNQQIVDVEYDLGQNGVWVTSWLFTKDGDNWTADQYQVSMKQ